MKKEPAGKLLEATLVAPTSIAVPGFALIYSRMWGSLLAFSLPLSLSVYYTYSNISNGKSPAIGISILLSVHFLSLTYILVAKSKGTK